MNRIISAPLVWKLVAFTALLAISGCAQPALNYVQPPGLTAQTGATITGSMDADPNPLQPDTHVILLSVDNLATNLDWHGWKTPTLVTPGMHLLTFGPCQCGYLANNGPLGSITLAANFAAGKSYILRSTLPASQGLFSPEYASAWIIDNTGAPVTAATPLQMQVRQTAVFVPVFIPAK